MSLTEEQLNQHTILSRVLNKKIFELNFPGINLDELEKEDLVVLVNKLQDSVNKLKSPGSVMTSKKLVDLYLKSFPKFPKLQVKLLKLLSDQEPKDKRQIITKLYGRKNDRPDAALRQLVVSTNETIKINDAADVFHIEGKNGKLMLKITLTNLSINLKKRTRKITK